MGPKCERAVGTEVRPSRCSRRDEPLGGRWSEWVELAGIDGLMGSSQIEELFLGYVG